MTRQIFHTIAFLTLLFFFVSHPAAGESGLDEKKDSTNIQQKDVVDIFHHKIVSQLRKDSLKLQGKGPFISIMPVVGYSMQSGLTGAIISNTSFYTDDSKSRFSNLLLNGYYSQFHQYWFTANTNIFFEKHKIHLFGDTRYYNFPTQTYGLGTDSQLSDELDIKFSYLRIYQYVYRELRPNIYAGIGYNLDSHWNIKSDTIPGKAYEDLKKYQKDWNSISSGLSFNLLFDNRVNSVNPDKGSYVFLQYRTNLTFLGSDANWQSMVIDLRHYIRLPRLRRNVLAFWNYNNFTMKGTPPYLDMPSVGWDYYSNTGRGYVPGRYTGSNFMYLESELRHDITRNGLFGVVVFANAETVFQNWSDSHSIIPGTGLGIRLKLNKHSNTNLAIDYGFGVGGSHGLFFNLGEVF